jgi:hypothetical protein
MSESLARIFQAMGEAPLPRSSQRKEALTDSGPALQQEMGLLTSAATILNN